MGEDSVRTDAMPDHATDLEELRAAVSDLARKFRTYGLDRLDALREEVGEDAEILGLEGRRRAHQMRQRLGEVEAKMERHVREHPLVWISGVLGAIGFGLVLGMILRQKD